MTEKKIDRRIQRTKMAIRKAFIDLMNEKGFDAITVSNIAERANINRGTFYVHYQDKYDLLEKTQSELINHVKGILLEQSNVNFADIYQVDMPLPIIVTFFTFMKNNAPLMRALYNFEGGLPLQAKIRHLIKTNLKIDYAFNKTNFLVPSEYLLSYAISAHFGVIKDWLEKGCIETPEEMAIIFAKITCWGVLHCTGLAK